MKTRTTLTLAAILVCSSVSAQPPKPQKDIAQTLKAIAGNIISNTSFKIVNTKTGERYDSSAGLPMEKGYNVESPYNKWHYWNGVLNLGFMAMGETLGDTAYTAYAKNNVSFAFRHDDYFRELYKRRLSGSGMDQKYRLAMLDDCGAMGASVIAVYALDAQKAYRDYAERAATYIMEREHRLADGTFCRLRPNKTTVWGDDLYMGVPFLARMGKLTGETEYFDEAARQVMLFNKHLWDETTGLYFHAWYDDIGQNGVARWGRCNGWVAMAQVELLAALPNDHPRRSELTALLTRQIVNLARYQDASGLWHQLLDKSDTYLETSATAIFTFAIAKAVNEGWIDARYAYVAAQGWQGVASRIRAEGHVSGICAGTGISPTNAYYATRPTPTDDIHGLGPILLAGCEVMKMYEKGIPAVWGL